MFTSGVKAAWQYALAMSPYHATSLPKLGDSMTLHVLQSAVLVFGTCLGSVRKGAGCRWQVCWLRNGIARQEAFCCMHSHVMRAVDLSWDLDGD